MLFPVYWMVNSAFLPGRVIRAPEPTFVPFGGGADAITALLGGPGIALYIGGILLMPSHVQAKAPAVAWVERTFDGTGHAA